MIQEQRWPIAREGLPYLVPVGLATVSSAVLGWASLTFLGFLLTLVLAFFFRNLEREIPDLQDAVLSPADGTVIDVRECREDRFLRETALKVTISTSIVDAHLMRAPVSGKVLKGNYQPGWFSATSKGQPSFPKGRHAVILETEDCFRFLLVHMAGFVAKKAVCYASTGSHLKKGQIFGLTFRSRVDFYLPMTVKPTVWIGQHVKGGESIIAYRS